MFVYAVTHNTSAHPRVLVTYIVSPQVLGILSLFVMPVPLLLKQSYTVWVGI